MKLYLLCLLTTFSAMGMIKEASTAPMTVKRQESNHAPDCICVPCLSIADEHLDNLAKKFALFAYVKKQYASSSPKGKNKTRVYDNKGIWQQHTVINLMAEKVEAINKQCAKSSLREKIAINHLAVAHNDSPVIAREDTPDEDSIFYGLK